MTEDWRVNRVDELTLRDRTEHGAFGPVAFDHNELHQVENRTAVDPAGYTWGVNGNISTRTGGPYGDAIFTHDWRDRLASVEQGSTITDILVDPLGRMVGKVKHTADGDVARAYLHDGDQVAIEYVQPAGSTNWQPERRHIWSTWIDQLAVEQIDTDGDGTLETTLYPITDMLGSVQLLTDDSGAIVERIEYDPDGTPHFWSADTQGPAVNRVVWTGDGTTPSGAVTPQVFEIGFSEVVDAASVAGVSATLTPEGGSAVELSVTIAADGRSADLNGATITAGVNYALHVEGLKDPSGNALQPEDRMVSVADDQVFEVLTDTVPPLLVAVMDAVDGVYLLFDEAVVGSGDLTAAVTINRQGVEVDGETTRINANVLKWTPAEPTTWLLAAQYALTGINVEDLGGNAVDAASMSFTHLAIVDGQLLIARQAATESVPMGASAFGVTSLFQGRTWHSDLGMYYYRARWYLPEGGVFGERDPFPHLDGSNPYQFLANSMVNTVDSSGMVVSYSEGAEPISASFKFYRESQPETWLKGQSWWQGVFPGAKNGVRQRPWYYFRDFSRSAYIEFPAGAPLQMIGMLRCNWIENQWIRHPVTPASAHAGNSLMLLMGNWEKAASSQQERNSNIAIQRMRLTQIALIVQFLRAVGDDALAINKESGSDYFQWGDPFVSKGAVLASTYLIEHLSDFKGLGDKKYSVIGALLQAIVVNTRLNGGWGGHDVVLRTARMIAQKTDVTLMIGKPRDQFSKAGKVEGQGEYDTFYSEWQEVKKVDGRELTRSTVEYTVGGGAGSVFFYSPKR
jgi:RHS repeat-associated protein